MASWTTDRPGLPVLSLKRPKNEVEHIHFALCNDAVLLVAEEKSEEFICYSLLNEFSQRQTEKWAVLLTDTDCSDTWGKQLTKTLTTLLPKKPVICLGKEESAQVRLLKSLISDRREQNTLITSPEYLLDCFANRYLKPDHISLVIANRSLALNVASDTDDLYSQVFEIVKNSAVTTRIVGLMHLKQTNISRASDLNALVNHAQTTYGLPVHLSWDFFAMNNYGEEIDVETVVINTKPTCQRTSTIHNLLGDISKFLNDMNIKESSRSLQTLKSIVLWSMEILIMFGLWSFKYILESVRSAFKKLEGEENDSFSKLAIHLCRSQFEVFQKSLNSASQTESSDAHSELMHKILDIFILYKEYCNIPASASPDEMEDGEIPTEDQPVSLTCEQKSQEQEEAKHVPCSPMVHPSPSETTNILETRSVKLKSVNRFRCLIVVKNKSFAKMLSMVINHLSSSDKKYSLFKCGCIITQPKKASGSGIAEEAGVNDTAETVLRAVQQGLMNIVVTTARLSSNLLVSSVNVLVQFGVPDSYKMYFRLKQRIRRLAPKLVLVLPEGELLGCQRNLQLLQNIEEQIEKRVSGFLSLKTKERWLKCLSNDSLRCYAPFGEDGPSVSMISSIHVVNSHCRRIARGDFSSLHAQFVTRKRDVSENIAMVTSSLYLPLGSSCRKKVVGRAVEINKKDDLQVEVGVLKSKMEAALECVRLLHENGSLDDDLDLTELLVESADKEEGKCELEDEGKGRAGTKKRRRAYKIKTPSFLGDNMPLANQPLFLHNIDLVVSKVYNYGKGDVFDKCPTTEIELGILSRKPLPRIPTFTIYTTEREVDVSVTPMRSNTDPLFLDTDILDRIKIFHEYVFQDLLKTNEKSMLSEKDGYLIVPLVSDSSASSGYTRIIHFHLLKEIQLFVKNAAEPRSLKSTQPCTDFSIFENRIVRRLNQFSNQMSYTKHLVVKVCEDMNPSSPFTNPEIAPTFFDYYRDRYGVEVDLHQPLLLVRYAPCQINFLFPRYSVKDARSMEEVTERVSRTELHLIPELCSILPLSVSAWSIIRYLPTIVYRLNMFLLAYEFKYRIQEETGIGCQPWPGDVPLPALKVGDAVGQERLDNFASNGKEKTSCEPGTSTTCKAYQELCACVPAFADDLLKGPRCCKDGYVGEERQDSVSSSVEAGKVSGNFGAQGNHSMNSDTSSARDRYHGNHVNDRGREEGYDWIKLDKPHSESLPLPTTGPEIGPCVTLILRALTAKSAGLFFHSERLEVLGDAFLKLQVSLEMYLTHPDKEEYGLSIYRGILVSNSTLSSQGRRLGLPGYMSIAYPDIGKNTLPPGFIMRDQGNQPTAPDDPNISEISLNIYRHQVLGDKLVANCVEALVGAYLVSCGRSSAQRFLIWLGITTHTLEDLRDLFNNSASNFEEARLNCETTINQGDIYFTQDSLFWYVTPSGQLPPLSHIEVEIGYCFKNKYLLLQAVMHDTYSKSLALVSESYQRMEFLGDAILDYVVTLYLFDRFPRLDHGDLTDFRSALVNNFTLAFLAVQSRLHQSLRCMSPALVTVVVEFVLFVQEQEAKQGASWKTSVDAFVVGNPETEESNVEVPKVLGDIFEALVGAIFFDCGMDLDVVWSVLYPMLRPFIDYYKENIPRSPVRTLQETFPDQVSFSSPLLTLSKQYTCNVCVVGYGTFEATGRTPKIAKASAARKALQHVRSCSDIK